MEKLAQMTLEEITLLGDEEAEANYYYLLAELQTSRISKKIVEDYEGDSIASIWERIMEAEHNLTSEILFPGDLVVLYPSTKEQKAKDYITCDFSGGIIYPGSLYVNYRPLLENITTGETYVLQRTIKVETGYQHDLPTTIGAFETLERNMQLEYGHDETGIKYSHLNQVMGGELTLQKLKRRKEKWD